MTQKGFERFRVREYIVYKRTARFAHGVVCGQYGIKAIGRLDRTSGNYETEDEAFAAMKKLAKRYRSPVYYVEIEISESEKRVNIYAIGDR